MKKVETDKAPASVGHYSQGIIHNGLVYVSGQVATDPQTGESVTSSIEAQTERSLRNLEAVLTAAGSNLSSVLKLTVYLTGIEHWASVNGVIAEVFGEHKPARAIIPVGVFSGGLLIEVDAIGVVNG